MQIVFRYIDKTPCKVFHFHRSSIYCQKDAFLQTVILLRSLDPVEKKNLGCTAEKQTCFSKPILTFIILAFTQGFTMSHQQLQSDKPMHSLAQQIPDLAVNSSICYSPQATTSYSPPATISLLFNILHSGEFKDSIQSPFRSGLSSTIRVTLKKKPSSPSIQTVSHTSQTQF